MYQYTTPTLVLTLADVDFDDVATFRVAMENKGQQLLKEIAADDSSVDSENNTITIVLTQEETAAFSVGEAVIQVRVVFSDGSVLATAKKRFKVQPVLDEVVV